MPLRKYESFKYNIPLNPLLLLSPHLRIVFQLPCHDLLDLFQLSFTPRLHAHRNTRARVAPPYSDVILNVPEVEVFLVRPMPNPGVWKVLAKPGKKLRLGMKVVFAEDFAAEVMCKEKDGTILVQFNEDDFSVRAKANKYGEVPLPPYISNEQAQSATASIDARYQTVYAKEEGSVAAPTAGFHFTPELIQKLEAKGVQFAEVTLHVGLGTFLPVKTDSIEEHQMHSEWVEVTAKNADLINQAKAEGRRVTAVGTTTVRTLEGVVQTCGELKAFCGDINIFISPGFTFKVVDAMITNFHLPKSTLLMLVSAFAGDREFVIDCYKKAVEAKYRFYSFGDAMFIY
jgi:S-adenosylmethionine:tRNA ribosyltransferase-isomerase